MTLDNLFNGTKMYQQQFVALCETLQQYLGASNAAYLNINQDSGAVYIHSNLKWLEGYIDGEHYKLDRHMVHPNNMGQGFCLLMLSNIYNYQTYNDALLYTAENKFEYGFTYVIKTDTDFSAFSFTTDKHKIINAPLNEGEIIKSFLQNINDQILTSFPKLEENRTNLVNLKGELFFQQSGIVFSNELR